MQVQLTITGLLHNDQAEKERAFPLSEKRIGCKFLVLRVSPCIKLYM